MSIIPGTNDILAILPAIILSGSGIVFLVLQFLFRQREFFLIRYLCGISVLGALVALIYTNTDSPGYGLYFHKQFILSPWNFWFTVLYLVVGFLTIVSAPRVLQNHGIDFPEFYPLLLFALTGMIFMTSGFDFILIFVGLELLSISLYILIGLARSDEYSLEATLKYFLLGAFSSGFMLMGIALLFGGSGTTQVELSILHLSTPGFESNYGKIGLVLFLIGASFKIGLFPFHGWIPDVYEGALTPITAFMSTAPKAAAIGLVVLIFHYLPDSSLPWETLIATLAVLSMTFGNVMALRQENLKRLLAYSSIAHAGTMVAGLVTDGTNEILFYLIIYSFMSLAAFAIIAYLENGEKHVTLSSLNGLKKSKPWTAWGLALVFLSFAGVPPLGGFWAKFFIFLKIAQAGTDIGNWVLVLGLANSAVALLYYFRVVLALLIQEEEGSLTKLGKIPASLGLSVTSVVSLLIVVVGWLFFQPRFF